MSIEGRAIEVNGKVIPNEIFPVGKEIAVWYFEKTDNGDESTASIPKNRAGHVTVLSDSSISLSDKDRFGKIVPGTARIVEGEAINDLGVSYHPNKDNVTTYAQLIFVAPLPNAK
jgi:hypothetical protein